MNMIASISDILARYEISVQRGFLPDYTPLLRLGNAHEAWEQAAEKLPEWIAERQMESILDDLPNFPLNTLTRKTDKERAFLIIAHIAHAYLWEDGEMRKTLPAKVAVPFVSLADELGRPAVVHHASNVLYNWRKVEEAGELIAENLQALVTFNGSKDEHWFYNVTTEIEAVGASALPEMVQLRMANEYTEERLIETSLKRLNQTLKNMIQSLEKMRLHCHPERFYYHVRPFLASLVDLHYEGVPNPLRTYAGGSAAQSSLIQAFDIVLGVKHPHASGAYLVAMRDHMPPAHKAFLEWLELDMEVERLISDKESLQGLFEELNKSLMQFRNTHLKIVAQYIVKPAREAGLSSEGTGGTDALTFLKEVRNDMRKNK